jgi:hypothetical protein
MEFYLAKGTEKFIFGWYLLSGILLDNIVEFATLGGCRSPRHIGE